MCNCSHCATCCLLFRQNLCYGFTNISHIVTRNMSSFYLCYSYKSLKNLVLCGIGNFSLSMCKSSKMTLICKDGR